MTMRTLAWCGAFIATAVALGAGQVPPQAPQLSCAFILDGAEVVSRPARVSNLKRIPLQATLIGPSAVYDELRLAGIGGQPAATLEIVALRRTPTNQRLRVVPATVIVGNSVEPDSQRLSMTLEFPIDPATRRQNVEQFLARVDQLAAADPQMARFRPLLQNRPSTLATFEQMYIESVPGDYEVTCRYSSRRPRFWNGSIDSGIPLRLQVANDGTFFDQPGFK